MLRVNPNPLFHVYILLLITADPHVKLCLFNALNVKTHQLMAHSTSHILALNPFCPGAVER